MATLAEIKAEVLRIVEEDITELSDAITTHVQRAQREIEDRCEFDIQRTTTLFEVRQQTGGYDIPSDFIAPADPPYMLDDVAISSESPTSGSHTRTFLVERDEFASLGNRRIKGKPKYWKFGNNFTQIQFWPRGNDEGPGTSGAWEVEFGYFKRLDTLENDSDTNWWSENLDDVLAFRVAAMVFAEMRDPLANFWDQRALARLAEFRNQHRRNKWRNRGGKFLYPMEFC